MGNFQKSDFLPNNRKKNYERFMIAPGFTNELTVIPGHLRSSASLLFPSLSRARENRAMAKFVRSNF